MHYKLERKSPNVYFQKQEYNLSKHFNADLLLLLLFITHGGLEVTSHPD